MHYPIELLILGTSILFLLSVISSKAAAKLGVPVILLIIGLGMLAGADGPGGIDFDDPWIAQFLGVVALTFIIFSGAMNTSWPDIRDVLGTGIILSTLGVAITASAVGLLAWLALGFSPAEGFLLGAIVSSTDAAAVFSMLRARNIPMKRKLCNLLEFESGSNDPMAVFATMALLRIVTGGNSGIGGLVGMFFAQVIVGLVGGWVMGKLIVRAIKKVNLDYTSLYPVFMMSLVLLTYGATSTLGGSGFLAVYITGLVLGNSDIPGLLGFQRFFEAVAWLMQITMFLILGLLVFPSQLDDVFGSGLLLSVFLVLIARPLSVFVTLYRSSFTNKEKAMISWVGLRGAVPIILATFPLLANVPKANTIFNLVFFIVITSVLLQGTTIGRIAGWLGLNREDREQPDSANPA